MDTPQAHDLEEELHQEMPEGHVLKGRSVTAVAVRRHINDAVFWLPVSEWALAHLTRQVESDPRWPSSFVTPDWQVSAAQLD